MNTFPIAGEDLSSDRHGRAGVWANYDIWSTIEEELEESRVKLETYPFSGTNIVTAAVNESRPETVADYSVGNRYLFVAPDPRPFWNAHYEMDSYRNLEDGWDGVGSLRISPKAIDVALEFLDLLPREVLSPEASASGDGTVDWYWRSDGGAATVTFYEDGLTAYFVMGDGTSVKGSFKFTGSIPDELIKGLREF